MKGIFSELLVKSRHFKFNLNFKLNNGGGVKCH